MVIIVKTIANIMGKYVGAKRHCKAYYFCLYAAHKYLRTRFNGSQKERIRIQNISWLKAEKERCKYESALL